MKKTYLFWFAILAFLLLGCRNDNFNPHDPDSNQQFLKFRVVPRSEIPQIINDLQAKTNNFKVPLKNHTSVQGKVETVFGEINTGYIIETTNGTDQVFYTFPITPYTGNDSSETYNLVVKTDDRETESAKVVVYEPAAEWVSNGNDDYRTFSGKVYTYSLDGNIENAVAYLNGNCNPEPCPDCPTNPPGPGPGPGPGPNPPGNPPTGSGGPVSYPGNGGNNPPPPPPNPPGPTPGQPGTTSGGIRCYWTCVFTDGQCTKMECIAVQPSTFTANRAPANTCDQQYDGGVVITEQMDPCTKGKAAMNTMTNVKNSSLVKTQLDQLGNYANTSTIEYGVTIAKVNGILTGSVPFTDNNSGDVKIPSPTQGDYIAHAHSHPTTGAVVPSPADIYGTLLVAFYYNTFAGSYVFSSNGNVYAIAINNRQSAIAFLAAYPKDTNVTNGGQDFTNTSEVGIKYNDIKKCFSLGRCPSYSGSSQNDGLESATAWILNEFNSGMSLGKMDANGVFKTLNPVSFDYVVPASGGQHITAYKTEKCP